MKYYAVKKGRRAGIYTSWDACKDQVLGFSDAKYKSFDTKEEAEEYIKKETRVFNDTEIEAYVDGSYSEDLGKYSYGCIIIRDGKVIHKMKGCSSDVNYIEMRNVAGELEAAVQAIKWALQNGEKSIRIYHDYQGIASWANGEWKTNKYGTQEYASFINSCSSEIRVEFTKVKGHSGQKYNEMADQLAKEGLRLVDTVDCVYQYNEFWKTYKCAESKVSYVVQEKRITEKSIMDFVKTLLKKRGYKKITNIKVEYFVLKGCLKITFDTADSVSNEMSIKIFNLEGRNDIS